MTTKPIFAIYSTFANTAEAVFVANALLEKKLVACVNIHEGIDSLYRWEGKIRQEKEAAFTAKTTEDKLTPAMAAIKDLHPYALPCIVAYKIEKGFPPFLQWVADETN